MGIGLIGWIDGPASAHCDNSIAIIDPAGNAVNGDSTLPSSAGVPFRPASLITENGSIPAHGSIVAWWYGIVAVVSGEQ